MVHKILKYSVAAIFFLLNYGCNTEEKQSNKKLVRTVKVKPVQKSMEAMPIRAIGHISPISSIKLGFKIGGVIDFVAVREGDKIDKGQLVAKLKPDEIESKVMKARLAVDKADRDLQRVENLYSDSVATLEQLQNAQTAFQLAKYDLRAADFNLEHSKITSPVDGTVLKKLAEEGEIIGQGYPVVVISSKERSLVVEAAVTDKEWREIAIGDSVQIKIDAIKNSIFMGYISQIDQISDPYTGTYGIECSLYRMPQRIAPGMMSRIVIIPSKRVEQLVLPVDALLEASGSSGYVYIVDKGVIKKTSIEVNRIMGDKLYITEGLSENDFVVTDGKLFVNNGDLVKTVTQ